MIIEKIGLARSGVNADYGIYSLEGSASKAASSVKQIKQSGAKAVIALGSLATDASVKDMGDISIVAAARAQDGLPEKGSQCHGSIA